MAVEYDGAVLQRMAGRLYNQAARAVAMYTLAGLLLGSGVGLSLAGLGNDGSMLGLAIGAIVGLLLGWAYGDYKALRLRGEAQSLLCHVQIEANTAAAAGEVR